MNFPDFNRSILKEISTPEWEKRNLTVLVKRDDLIHDEISGNKWRKLVYNIEQAQLKRNDTILTFGGAFSNHLVATACAAKLNGLKAIGIVRGEELTAESNATLQRCKDYGMELVFVSRELYHLRNDRQWWEELHLDYPNSLIIPEGGANFYGVLGCQEIWKELPKDTDRIFVAQGTTTTSCGILLGAPKSCFIHAVPVLKGFDAEAEMKQLLYSYFLDEELLTEFFSKLKIEQDYHFGGYGKYTPELLNYITEKYRQFGLKLDPVYTGKAFSAMEDLIQKLDLRNEKIIFIHTGGIQGSKGIEEKEGIELYE
ncbi:MAG: pyridoxal-phosphate dependent enzyme [Flavobacteriia bacterium]|nr:pyridoxal-phosphate dependent enzyme [Flavobacteriia bacterium]OJX36971.1 MAG: hypothetical protein BGO87_14425 [Flavobacteriia bacterium 40-80]